jgi:ankyrin repeat protein
MLLHCAAANGRADIANTLLAKGADVNIGADGNVTPLFLAAQNGEDNIVALLLSQPGIIVTNPITSNQQLLTEYVAARSLEIQQRMTEFIDGQPNPDEIHMQPIDMARVMGHEQIVALLQDKLQVNNKFNL